MTDYKNGTIKNSILGKRHTLQQLFGSRYSGMNQKKFVEDSL